MPARMTALRKVVSCSEGVQAATITRSRPSSSMSLVICPWPSSEHMKARWRLTETPSSRLRASATASTSTTSLMLPPQWQT